MYSPVAASRAPILHDELLDEAAVEGLDIAGVDGFLHIGLDGDVLVGLELDGSGVAGETLLLPVVVLGQRVEDGDDEVVRALIGNSAAGGLGVVQIRVCFHPPVKGIADVVGPLAHDAALAAVGALHHVGVDDVVDLLAGPGVAAPLGLHIAVDDGILAAAALGTVSLFKGCHLAAVLGDDGIVALRQAADEAVCMGGFGCCHDLFKACIRLAVGNVFPHGTGPQPCILQHHAVAAAQGGAGDVGADADTVCHLAGLLIHQVDIGSRLRPGTGCQRMLAVIENLD